MNKDSKIYIAGHDGLVGTAVYGELINQGYNNIVTRKFTELDLRNQNETENFFKTEKPDYVFLCAAKVGGIIANSSYKAEFIYDNIMIAANVINSSWKHGVKKLLNLGSSCIYPKFAQQPLKEEYLLSGYLEPTNDAYALAKIAAIKLCNSYNEQYNTNFISAMPTNLYGLNDNYNLETSHVLPAMIRKFYLGRCLEQNDWDSIKKDLSKNPIPEADKFSNEDEIHNILEKFGILKDDKTVTITLWGDGTPLREFLYSDDLAKAVVFLMNKVNNEDMPDGFLNIGTGKDISIYDLALLIKEISGFSGNIEWDRSKPNGTPRKLLDACKITELGWRPEIKLEDGVKIVYSGYK